MPKDIRVSYRDRICFLPKSLSTRLRLKHARAMRFRTGFQRTSEDRLDNALPASDGVYRYSALVSVSTCAICGVWMMLNVA